MSTVTALSSEILNNLLSSIQTEPFDQDLRKVVGDFYEEGEEPEQALRHRNIAALLSGPTQVGRTKGTARIAKSIPGIAPRDIMEETSAPGYQGNKICLVCACEMSPGRFGEWDEGSITYRYWMWIDKGKVEKDPLPVLGGPVGDSDFLTKNSLCVHHDISCGKDTGLAIYGLPDTLVDLLDPGTDLTPPELSWAEKVVLAATRSYKSSYAGNPHYRFSEANRYTGIQWIDWCRALGSLVEKKLLNKALAITSQGKNAINNISLSQLDRENKGKKGKSEE